MMSSETVDVNRARELTVSRCRVRITDI